MSDKWGRLFFKAGGFFLLILGLIHSISLFQKPIPANDTEKQLLDLMSSYTFTIMGSHRTMHDFLQGFSICFMLAAFGFGFFDLLLARERASLLKRVALLNVIWLAVMTFVSLRYFFAAPSTFLTIALLIFVLAWLKLPAADALAR
jgi:hypothetical protein